MVPLQTLARSRMTASTVRSRRFCSHKTVYSRQRRSGIISRATIPHLESNYPKRKMFAKTRSITVPLPKPLIEALARLRKASREQPEDALVFHTLSGKPYSDTNLLHRELKPAGQQVGAPWFNWHTLSRTHCTLFQVAGGSLRDAEAQLGHTKMSTTSRSRARSFGFGDEW
jgi:integrase